MDFSSLISGTWAQKKKIIIIQRAITFILPDGYMPVDTSKDRMLWLWSSK